MKKGLIKNLALSAAAGIFLISSALHQLSDCQLNNEVAFDCDATTISFPHVYSHSEFTNMIVVGHLAAGHITSGSASSRLPLIVGGVLTWTASRNPEQESENPYLVVATTSDGRGNSHQTVTPVGAEHIFKSEQAGILSKGLVENPAASRKEKRDETTNDPHAPPTSLIDSAKIIKAFPFETAVLPTILTSTISLEPALVMMHKQVGERPVESIISTRPSIPTETDLLYEHYKVGGLKYEYRNNTMNEIDRNNSKVLEGPSQAPTPVALEHPNKVNHDKDAAQTYLEDKGAERKPSTPSLPPICRCEGSPIRSGTSGINGITIPDSPMCGCDAMAQVVNKNQNTMPIIIGASVGGAIVCICAAGLYITYIRGRNRWSQSPGIRSALKGLKKQPIPPPVTLNFFAGVAGGDLPRYHAQLARQNKWYRRMWRKDSWRA